LRASKSAWRKWRATAPTKPLVTAAILNSGRIARYFAFSDNIPSLRICRSLGFRFAGERDVTFAGRVLRSNHWVINPVTDLT
jgi:predicted GNAT family acetyltransferase